MLTLADRRHLVSKAEWAAFGPKSAAVFTLYQSKFEPIRPNRAAFCRNFLTGEWIYKPNIQPLY